MPLIPIRLNSLASNSLALAALCALAACDKAEPTAPPVSATQMLFLSSPTAGSKLKVGDTLAVKWTVKDDPTGAGRSVDAVDIFLSPNGGHDWGTLTRSGSIKPTDTKQWGNYKWAITDSVYIQDLNQKLPLKGATNCRVKIQDYTHNTDADLADSSGLFSVNP
jgi:hypothetical protein